MRLAQARSIRDELLSRLFAAVGRRAARHERGLSPPAVAVGVAPRPGSPRDYRVALRISRVKHESASALLRDAEKHPRDFDVALVPRFTPRGLRPGMACGHERLGCRGTLGGFVEDDDGVHILSNSHVLAECGRASAGDPIVACRPARGKARTIARLSRWTPLTRTDRPLDVAIARLMDDAEPAEPRRVPGLGLMNVLPVAERHAVRDVAKRGRTTGVTRGRVSAFDLDGVVIDYGTRRRPMPIVFRGQVEFVGLSPRRPFSRAGDSGSFILDARTLRPFALLFAGGRDARGVDRTLGHFMPEVLAALRVRLPP